MCAYVDLAEIYNLDHFHPRAAGCILSGATGLVKKKETSPRRPGDLSHTIHTITHSEHHTHSRRYTATLCIMMQARARIPEQTQTVRARCVRPAAAYVVQQHHTGCSDDDTPQRRTRTHTLSARSPQPLARGATCNATQRRAHNLQARVV